MVNTKNTVPRVLDETLRSLILQVVQEANGLINAALTTLQTDLNTLIDIIQALTMFQTFATRELTKLGNRKGTSNRGGGYGTELTKLGNRNGTSNRGGGYGTLTKLDFPKFNGEDVTGWLFIVQQLFLINNVQEDQKSGVATDPLKIQAMASWPIPTTLKQLREVTFNQPKQAMMNTPVLALPNFEKEFMVETNASGSGIGDVLHQERHHITHLSKDLSPRHQDLSTYEKEFLAVMMAFERWRGWWRLMLLEVV
nr:putative nucleotidyltransferase, ribonuclease H [Tanacetum cinerariifolium]